MNERLQDVLGMLPEACFRTKELHAEYLALATERRARWARGYNMRFRERNKGTPKAQLARNGKLRAQRNANSPEFTEADLAADEIKRTTRRCTYCNCPLEAKNVIIDHIIPLSRGGKHERGNIAGCCHHCNCSKGSKLNWKPKPEHMYVEP